MGVYGSLVSFDLPSVAPLLPAPPPTVAIKKSLHTASPNLILVYSFVLSSGTHSNTSKDVLPHILFCKILTILSFVDCQIHLFLELPSFLFYVKKVLYFWLSLYCYVPTDKELLPSWDLFFLEVIIMSNKSKKALCARTLILILFTIVLVFVLAVKCY